MKSRLSIKRVARVARIALIQALILGLPLPATAHHVGAVVCNTTVQSQCVANNGSHLWYPVQLNANMEEAMAWSDANNYDPLVYVQMVRTTAFASTDVQVFDGSYGFNGLRGWTQCQVGATYGGAGVGRWCLPQKIAFNNGNPGYPGEFNNIDERKFIACHEIGHTLGLHHSSETGSCMRDFAIGAPGGRPTALTPTDRSHLDAWYD